MFRLLEVFAPAVFVGVCMCVRAYMLFHGAHLFSDAHMDLSGSPLGKEKVQNAMTPDGKYYAFVNKADVSPLTLAFRPNQTPTGEDEPHMEMLGW